MTPSISEQRLLLSKELGTLIGRLERLRPSPVRDALVRELEHYLDQLRSFMKRKNITLH